MQLKICSQAYPGLFFKYREEYTETSCKPWDVALSKWLQFK